MKTIEELKKVAEYKKSFKPTIKKIENNILDAMAFGDNYTYAIVPYFVLDTVMHEIKEDETVIKFMSINKHRYAFVLNQKGRCTSHIRFQ